MAFETNQGYPVTQKVDVIQKNEYNFYNQGPKVSKKQFSDLTQQKVCSPVLLYKVLTS